MHHAVQSHIVNKGRLAEHLAGEIDPRRVAPDDPVLAGRLAGARPVASAARSTRGGERPVIMAGRLAAVGDRAVLAPKSCRA